MILTSQHHIQKNLTISSSRCKQTATSGLVKIFLPALRNKMTTIIFTVVLLLTFFQAEPPLQKINLDRFYDEIPTDNCGKLSQTPFEVTLANDINIDFCTMMFYHVKHSRQTPPSIPIELKQRWHRAMIMLALSRDISLNPCPVKYPCGLCSKSVASNHRAVLCEVCYYWHHIKCVQISPSEYKLLSASEDSWVCSNCSSFQFTVSYFDSDQSINTSTNSSLDTDDHVNSVFETLKESRRKHPTNFTAAYININSVRYKFDEIKELLTDKIVDFLVIAETKIDQSFNDNLFQVEGFKMFRRDRNSNG